MSIQNIPAPDFTDAYVAHSQVVIFTGSPKTKDLIMRSIPTGTLLIFNGAGHNPIVVSETANIN